MYSIEKTDWGVTLTFGGFMDASEMRAWVNESKEVLKDVASGFGVLVDMRTLKPLSEEVQAVMQEGQKLYKGQGMSRSVVILASAVVTMQFKRIAKETGIYAWERYIDASSNANWQEKGIAWVRDTIDPDGAVAA